MGCSSSKAGAAEQLTTLLQSRERLKPGRSRGPSARSEAAPAADEASSLLEDEQVNDTDACAVLEASDERQVAEAERFEVGSLLRPLIQRDDEDEEDGGEKPEYMTIEFNSPDEWAVDALKGKVLAALKPFGLNRFDLACFDFEAFDVQIGFDDLEGITDRSGSSCTSEQVAASLEEGETAGLAFPLSARFQIKRASEVKPLGIKGLLSLLDTTKNPVTYHEESCDDIITSVTLRRFLHQMQSPEFDSIAVYGVLVHLAGNTDSVGRDALVAAGFLQAVVQCMREEADMSDTFAIKRDLGYAFLIRVLDSTKRVESIANAGAGKVLPGLLATGLLPGSNHMWSVVSCIAALARDSRYARVQMAGAGVVRSLLQTAAHDMDCFEQCAIALSFYAGEVVEATRAGLHHCELVEPEAGIRLDQVAAAADSLRYGCFSWVKDSLLPLADVCLDAVNAYTLYAEGHYVWLAAQLAALCFNGCASALHEAADSHWTTTALDLLTFGTAGLVRESYQCFKQGVKSDGLITLKLAEACEAGISLAVVADTIVSAGTLPGYDKMSFSIAALRFSSLAASVASLSATAFDVDKRAVLSRTTCRHLRPILKSRMVQGAAFAYHVAEVSGLLVLVPLIQTTRPFGIYLLAGACFVLAASVQCFTARSVASDWIDETQLPGRNLVSILDNNLNFNSWQGCIPLQMTASGASAEFDEGTHGEVKALELHACGDMVFGPPIKTADLGIEYGPFNFIRSETYRYVKLVPGTSAIAGLARGLLMLVTAAPVYVIVNLLGVLGRRFQLAVAALRPALWLAAWSILGYRAATDEETYHMVTMPGVTAILAVALAGMVAYVPLALHQRSQGRWLHFQQFEDRAEARAREATTVHPRIVVSGAGIDDVNGEYIFAEVAVSDGSTQYYTKLDNKCIISFYPETSSYGPAWYIQTKIGAKGAYKSTQGDAEQLPTSGWEVYDGIYSLPGKLPVPTIGEADADDDGDGSVPPV